MLKAKFFLFTMLLTFSICCKGQKKNLKKRIKYYYQTSELTSLNTNCLDSLSNELHVKIEWVQHLSVRLPRMEYSTEKWNKRNEKSKQKLIKSGQHDLCITIENSVNTCIVKPRKKDETNQIASQKPQTNYSQRV